ncbi:MAG: thiamine phosphate synthase [Rubrobacter sp.]|nr:thiamine phosphate synthase [Rubrobacter sp.]
MNVVDPVDRLRDARLLLVTDPRPDLAERVAAAVRGGVDIVQLREKGRLAVELLALAEELGEVCARRGALFTVNDDPELARLSGAAGIHLGQEDMSTGEVRRLLGPETIVGRSAGTVEEAREAVRDGADYLGAGAVYATPTKPGGDVGGLHLLRRLSGEGLPVPVFAIGGVTLDTAAEVAATGVRGFAVVRAVLDAEDPEAAARDLRSYLPASR